MEQKINKPTRDFFVENIGDKITVEFEVTKNPNDLIRNMVKSVQEGTDWIDGLKVTHLYFKGRDPGKVALKQKLLILTALDKSINDAFRILDEELEEKT